MWFLSSNQCTHATVPCPYMRKVYFRLLAYIAGFGYQRYTRRPTPPTLSTPVTNAIGPWTIHEASRDIKRIWANQWYTLCTLSLFSPNSGFRISAFRSSPDATDVELCKSVHQFYWSLKKHEANLTHKAHLSKSKIYSMDFNLVF
jgi:hypothetical protein